jgi:uncharacterized YigZ family protein
MIGISMNDIYYYKPQKESICEIKIKKSVFISYISDISTEIEIRDTLNQVKVQHKQANHNCYAYRFGFDNITEYYSDDGEPSGTAGRPILNAIIKYKLLSTIIIVSRYFGGIKLGVRGLIDAYYRSACNVIEKSGIKKSIPASEIKFSVSYENYNMVVNKIKEICGDKIHPKCKYTDKIFVNIAIPILYKSDVENFLKSQEYRRIVNI